MERPNFSYLVCLLYLFIGAHGYTTHKSRTVRFPLKVKYSHENVLKWEKSFEKMVDSTNYFTQCQTNSKLECSVPAFNKARLSFQPSFPNQSSPPEEFVLTVNDVNRSDFGWICTKFHECKQFFEGFDYQFLDEEVEEHFNLLSSDTGCDASLTSDEKLMNELFKNDHSIMDELTERGYVVIDTNVKTSSASNAKLSAFLTGKSTQGVHIRSDNVACINKAQADEIGVSKEFDILMAIASYLNNNVEFEPSKYEPLSPGTLQNPLTNPKTIQAAEYAEGEYYVAHSDNLIRDTGVRNNFRYYTCILYCNEGWKPEYGGALRLYPGSENTVNANDAKKECDFEDIVPTNGRLLIFNSYLVHSVEKVRVKDRVRQALTIWIKRPEYRRQ